MVCSLIGKTTVCGTVDIGSNPIKPITINVYVMESRYHMFVTFVLDEMHDQRWWEEQSDLIIKSFIQDFGVENYIAFLRKIEGLDFSYYSFHIGIDKFIEDIDKLNSIWFKDAFIDYSSNKLLTLDQENAKIEFLKLGAIKIWSNNT